MSFHQIDADINLPTDPNLLADALPKEKLLAIYELIGAQELSRIAGVVHNNEGTPDWKAVFEREGRDLDVIRGAISKVTGKKRPWIIGYASEFAHALTTTCQNPTG
jgi:hypothetical protein